MKTFNVERKGKWIFVQYAVNALRRVDKNPKFSVVAETTKLLANNSCGYRNKDCSRHLITKYTNDEKNTCSDQKKCSRD